MARGNGKQGGWRIPASLWLVVAAPLGALFYALLIAEGIARVWGV